MHTTESQAQGVLTLRLPSYMLERIKDLSQNQERSVSGTVRLLIREGLERRQ